MPYINVKTNVEISEKDRIKHALGQLIEIIPGKNEGMTMVCLQDKQDLYFGGSDEPCVIVETLVNKGTNRTADTDYCAAVVRMLAEELNVPVSKIYSMVDEEDYWFYRRTL